MRAKKEKPFAALRKKLVVFSLFFLFIVLIISFLFGKKGFIEISRAKRNYASLIKQIEDLEQQRSFLQKEIEELKSNPGAVEREARSKLWLMKPDELVIVKRK